MTDRQYAQTIEMLEGLFRKPAVPSRKAGLRRIYALLNLLGNPHKTFRSVHVTGSSGKGSTTSMIGSVLAAQGFSTGLFRSPHLIDYTERIAVDGRDIDGRAWTQTFEAVWPLVERLTRNELPNYAYGRPTLIEVLFAMACVYFRDRRVEWTAIEAGLGGRLDPTNALAPDVAVVTNVSLEHTHVLGSTVAAIAAEKAAIIKPGGSAVTAADDREALEVITARAAQVGARLRVVGRDVHIETVESNLTGQAINVSDEAGTIEIQLPAAGRFQATNAAVAVAVAHALQSRGVHLCDSAITDGLQRVQIPGRMEIRSYNPLVVLDGAHNPAAARELAGAVREVLPGKRVHLVFAAMADKDVDGMVSALSPIATQVYATRVPGTDRAAEPETLAAIFGRQGGQAQVVVDPDDAFACARADAREDDVILITGSMYLVGWFRRSGRTGRIPR